MANHTTGAQRQQARYDKIWAKYDEQQRASGATTESTRFNAASRTDGERQARITTTTATTTDDLITELLETCPAAERIRMGKTRGTSDLRAIIDAIREEGGPLAASNTTAAPCDFRNGDDKPCRREAEHSGMHDCTNPDYKPESGVDYAYSASTSDSGRGDRATLQIGGYLATNRADGLRIATVNIPHPDGGGQDVAEVLEPYAEKFVRCVNGFEAMRDAVNFARKWHLMQTTKGRAGFPNQLCDALDKAAALAADPQP